MRLGFLLIPSFSALALAAVPPYLHLLSRPAPGAQRLEKLPLRFEKSASRERGEYVAVAPGFILNISSTESRLEWVNPANHRRAEVRTRLAGAGGALPLEPLNRLPGTANYFIGDAARWRTGVEAWEGVRCRDAFPGIDLVFHGNPDALEYDFVVKPHGDPRLIGMELTGQRRLAIDQNGDLVVSTSAGEIRWKHPDVYQTIGEVRRRVDGRFVLANRRTVRFEIGAYDSSRDLVIDPVLSYSTYLGGSGNDAAKSVCLDGSGNVYISGQTTSADLPVLSAAQSSNAGQGARGSGDVFVAKFSPGGSLLYLTYLGGSGDEFAMGMAVDAAGNAYITGFTTSPNFPIAGASPLQRQYGGSGGSVFYHTGDAFVAKLNPSGNKLIYSTYLGGSQDDLGMAIAIDSAGNAYVAGGTASLNFPATQGSYQTILKGNGGEPIEPCCGTPFIDPGDAFVVKIDPAGSKLLFSTFVGGTADDLATTIALDSSGNIYIAGYTMSSNFPTTAGALQRTWGGFEQQTPYFVSGDGFLAKLNPSATALQYSTYFGGNGDECVTSIAVDSTGAVYFTGYSSTMRLPTTSGALQSSYAGYQSLPFAIEYLFGDAIVGKLNPAGSQLVYLTYLGGSANDAGMAIAIDGTGNAFVAGWTDSPNFPKTSNAYQSAMGGDGGPNPPYISFGDGFLAEVNPAGTSLLYSTFFGGNRDDLFLGLALDGGGSVYLAGNSYSTNWKNTANAFQPKFGGFQSAYAWPWGDAVYTVFSGFAVTPSITKVANAEGEALTIGPNTWVEILGSGLAPHPRMWAASDFVNHQMPASLDGVSVTINGQNAFVYYISPGQVNVLTPLNLAAGTAQVVVTNNGPKSASFAVTAASYSTSLFVFNGGPYVAATHLYNRGCTGVVYCLVGPASLYPGSSTPAAPGETIVLYANGFGPVTSPVVSGADTQSGNLPSFPVVRIGNANANVSFSGLVSPGLYQFNVDVPVSAVSGDNAITVTFSGNTTQAGTLLTVK